MSLSLPLRNPASSPDPCPARHPWRNEHEQAGIMLRCTLPLFHDGHHYDAVFSLEWINAAC